MKTLQLQGETNEIFWSLTLAIEEEETTLPGSLTGYPTTISLRLAWVVAFELSHVNDKLDPATQPADYLRSFTKPCPHFIGFRFLY